MYFMGPIVYIIEDTSRHLLNEDTLFMYFWRYYLMKEVNEWTLSVKKISSLRNVFSFNWQKITWWSPHIKIIKDKGCKTKMIQVVSWFKIHILSFKNNNNNNTIDMQMKLNYNFSANAQFLLHTRTPKNS